MRAAQGCILGADADGENYGIRQREYQSIRNESEGHGQHEDLGGDDGIVRM